ncbi:hypothetical protein LINGRAHAP2_LOCUS10228, partial [Linum grandiflorum]
LPPRLPELCPTQSATSLLCASLSSPTTDFPARSRLLSPTSAPWRCSSSKETTFQEKSLPRFPSFLACESSICLPIRSPLRFLMV